MNKKIICTLLVFLLVVTTILPSSSYATSIEDERNKDIHYIFKNLKEGEEVISLPAPSELGINSSDELLTRDGKRSITYWEQRTSIRYYMASYPDTNDFLQYGVGSKRGRLGNHNNAVVE
ncbi:hypothetical protein ACERII_25330 [Evansella sp. AB-rgal1]|uniref:hypothetical protein n=1 Tax=Evansella sp. AB-rgal1 TaxID=3242696 RepID=UPI00359E9BA9